MTRSTIRLETLGRIVAETASGRPASELLDQVLEAAREAVGAGCMSLVATDGNQGSVRTWSATADGSQDIRARCLEAGTSACVHPNDSARRDGVCIFPVALSDGLRASLVCDTALDTNSADIIRGYITLLLENESLRRSLAAARDQTAKRIEEVAAVYEIGQAINSMDTTNLLNLITEKAAVVMDAQACSLLSRDFETDELTIEASWGLVDDIVQGTRIAVGDGIAGKVAATGEAMLLQDVGADPRLSGSVRPREGIVSSICAPFRDEMGRVMGVLNIRRHVPAEPFTEEDVRLFCVFASQAGLAISNAKLYSSLTRRISEISTISDLLRAINSTLNIDYVLNQIADNIVNVVGFDRCCVYLCDPRTDDLIAGVCRGYGDGDLAERVETGQGVVGLAAKERISIFARESDACAGKTGESEVLASPIVVRDECIGVVVVDNLVTGSSIQPDKVELLSTFVSQAGIAIENARLYEAMEEKYSELNVLFEHSKTISSAYGLENAAKIATDVAAKAVECDGCALVLLGDKRASIDLKASVGLPEGASEPIDRFSADDWSISFLRDLRSSVQFDASKSDALSPLARRLLELIAGEGGSMLVVPLLAEDAAVGALILFRRERSEFTTGETKLLSIVASQAAVVLKNSLRYEQRMRRQVLDLSTLYEFSRRISSSSSLEEALDAILSIVCDIVDVDESAIYAIDHEHGVMIPTAVKCNSGNACKLTPQPTSGNSVMSWTVRERKAVVSPDITSDPRFDHVRLSDRPVRSLMSIPLMVQDEAVGVLSVHSSSPNLYSEDDVRVLSIIASQSAAIYKELEALAALTSYTDSILSSIAAGVITLDSSGNILTWNRAAEQIVDIRAPQVMGRHYRDVINILNVSEKDKDSTIAMIQDVERTGEVYQGYKVPYHLSNGEVLYINLSASVLSNNAGDPLGLVIIFEDITKQIQMENDFRRMGELAAVGQLAASIAHELRNPLSSIKGAAQFLQNEYEHEPSIAEFLGIIIEEVNGLSKLTTEFLEYARPMEFDLDYVDLNGVVRKTLQLMNVHIRESGVSTTEDRGADLPTIYADEKQLEQVLRNILINALQAMPDGGRIHIRTRAVGGHSVELSVTDTGMGIPQEKLERIFVPFFTTKTKGTGLGLSVVQKIVENHGGHIEVTSEVGVGTTFRITLPVAGTVRPSPPEADTIDRRI